MEAYERPSRCGALQRLLLSVESDVGHRQKHGAMALQERAQLRGATHRAVSAARERRMSLTLFGNVKSVSLIGHLRYDSDGLTARQATEVNARLSVALPLQDASGTRHEGEHVTRSHKVLGGRGAARQRTGGDACTIKTLNTQL